MNKTQKQIIYLNPKLTQALNSHKPIVVSIMGRGGGKSTFLGVIIRRNIEQMPRSLGALWGLTYNQILTKILPSMKKMLLNCGLKQDQGIKSPGHFVIGKKPPPYFPQLPYNEPGNWENVLSFWNGAAIEFISLDRPDTGRGGSYDYMLVDEAVYMPKDKHDRIALLSLRGNRRYFGSSPFHGQRIYVSSQAWTQEGYWVEDQKFERDKTKQILKDEKGNPIFNKKVFCTIGTSYDNAAVLGIDTIEAWEAALPQSVVDVEIHSKRIEGGGDLFYDRFKESVHTYIKTYEYDHSHEKSEYGVYVKKEDVDRVSKMPLDVSIDFGTRINTMVIAQFHDKNRELRILQSLYEPSNKLISGLVAQFLKFYQNHGEKVVNLWGDPSGNKQQMEEKLSLFQMVAKELNANGWRAALKMKGRAYPRHKVRHQFINEILSETNPRLPRIRINRIRCKYLIGTLATVQKNDKGVKDKAMERADIDQRHATHDTDAFDYLIWYKFYKDSTKAANQHAGIRFGR